VSIPSLHALAWILLCSALMTVDAKAHSNAHPCTAVPEPTMRLACYDAAFPPAADARKGPVDLEAEREKALRDFGLNKVQLQGRQPEYIRDLTPDRIEAVVARVTSRATGERVVTLDNGQVWLLSEVTSKGWLAEGERVVIREAALGTFMLLTPRRVPLRARRID
jgi:hypothetical protein